MIVTGEIWSTAEKKNSSQCHFVHNKSHMDLPGIESVLLLAKDS